VETHVLELSASFALLMRSLPRPFRDLFNKRATLFPERLTLTARQRRIPNANLIRQALA
jgi:hypothetical protein